MVDTILLTIAVVLIIVANIILYFLFSRAKGEDLTAFQLKFDSFDKTLEKNERSVSDQFSKNREEFSSTNKQLREEMNNSIKNFLDNVVKTIGEMSQIQRGYFENFSSQLQDIKTSNQNNSQMLREEISSALSKFSNTISTSMNVISESQKSQLQAFSGQLETSTAQSQKNALLLKDEINKSISGLSEIQKSQLETFSQNLVKLTDKSEKSSTDLRQGLEAKFESVKSSVEIKLTSLQEDNSKKLDQIRVVVDEKLQGTLEKRLGESFKIVSERLEMVHSGLGEMKKLANGVGDLKKVLTNVKTRGTWGEVQLSNLLEQIFAPEQYEKNVAIKKGIQERVEYAIKLPGRDGSMNGFIYLPIDAKFPQEDYQRIIDASEAGDSKGIDAAVKELENKIKRAAKVDFRTF